MSWSSEDCLTCYRQMSEGRTVYIYFFSRSVIQTVTDILSSVGLPVPFHPAGQSHLLLPEAQQEGTQTGE